MRRVTACLMAAVWANSAALAQTPEAPARKSPAPFPEFQSKSLKPPKPGTQQRVTIQITPPEPTVSVSPPDPNVAKTASGQYAWFWDKISPGLEGTGPARLDDALQVIKGAQKVTTPRLSDLQDIISANAVPILLETVQAPISPALVLAMISVESAGQTDAVSTAGAEGLMQLMPDTAKQFGVSDPLDPAQNIAGGVRYLSWLMEKFDGDPILVLAGYNAGAGSIRDHHGVPDYAETRDYVPKVLAAFEVARSLCKTPPLLMSDGCVFQHMN